MMTGTTTGTTPDSMGVEEMAAEIQRLREKCDKQAMILQKITGRSGPFICGVAGEKGADGLEERIYVCPQYGLEGMAIYKKEKDYSSPGW